ncbi:LPP20 family lipoprotein [Bacteroidales bacterium OttesenSCG-928-I21]|nr:LPP20 family lipoprotein [Bacteroidales bacterium OttesenSCG-928-I21]
MERKYIFVISLFLTLLSSCQSGKNLSDKYTTKPDWVLAKPQTSSYYVGVSSAPKKGYSPGEYIQSAQQKALADMAASISVTIESSSVLSRIEDNYKLYENFSSEINATTNQSLENYELVSSWEDENYYWVYYRLSKNVYKEQKERKKQQILSESKNKLRQADDLLAKGSYYSAFQFYADAFNVLKPYLGESTQTEINGKSEDLGNYIFTKLAEFINDISIKFAKSEIVAKKAVNLDADIFAFSVLYKTNNTMSNIPVKINFTGSGLLRNSEISDSDGKIFCSIKKINSSPGVETLSASVDVLALSKVATDPMIRNIIKNIPATENKVRVKVEKPTIKIISSEKSFGKELNNEKLKKAFQSVLGSEFVFAIDDEYDFLLDITSNTTKNEQRGRDQSVAINYTFVLTDISGKNIFRKSSSNSYYGVSFEEANTKAYSEISTTIERFIAKDLINSLK